MEKHKYTNSLIHETSPYLLQHAHNPVNWTSWSDDIWDEATKNQSLVIVSIGYSTCHWCHVMEHECFEDEETAEKMNANFISIKVDREEMPDVDQVYMDACQLMTGRGGWPLNVVCTPDKRPVFAGTYFPKDHWNSILSQLSDLWATDEAKVWEYADRIEKGLEQLNLAEFKKQAVFEVSDLHGIAAKLSESFDYEWGGLKRSQKFPLPVLYEYLLDEYLSSGNKEVLDFVNFTLLQMANGGIYDQLRGGFYRYTTDPRWFAPHFEKMLYDNAQLLKLYSRAFGITGAPIYEQVALQIIAFADRELKAAEGGYYAALDADSEGIEGRFYVFTMEEILALLNTEETEFARKVYNLTDHGNWEHGYNILHKTLSPAQILEATGLPAAEFQQRLKTIQSKLFTAQESRIRPMLDTKVICSWNGLYLSALAVAAKHLKSEEITEMAIKLGDFIMTTFHKNGELIRNLSHNTGNIKAVSEDYAAVIQAMTDLYELTFDAKWLDNAVMLADRTIADYFDHEKVLFQSRSKKQNKLIIDKTDITDDVIPSVNSMLCLSLQKLGILCHREDYTNIGENMLAMVRSQITESPAWHSNWARAAQAEAIGMIQIVSNFASQKAEDYINSVPSWAIMAWPGQKNATAVVLKEKAPKGIFICAGKTCFEPVSETDQAMEILSDILPQLREF